MYADLNQQYGGHSTVWWRNREGNLERKGLSLGALACHEWRYETSPRINMKHLLLIALGGGVGAALRHLVSLVTLRLIGPGFPWGTFMVNVVGSFTMGLFIAWMARYASLLGGGAQNVRYLVATGLLGGFTTFSAFSLDFAVMWQRGDMGLAGIYALVSVLVSLSALFAGLWVVRVMAG